MNCEEECSPELTLQTAIRRGLWYCAQEIAKTTDSSDLRNLFDVESRVIQKELTLLKQIIDAKTISQSTITPAFQWAQSGSEIFLNVKFSHKIDAPATLNVEATNVNITSSGLLLLATDGRKNFKLQIAFLHEIIADQSTWSMGSVGRMVENS